ncbi:MAG: hypothetical protein IJZ94_03870 [Clostridia bacterium]|nr:hypothetical protein [Clostridia bacterium]
MEQKSDNTKVYSILSYIFILWLVGLICDKENETVKFHVNQGIWLTIVNVALGVVSGIFGIIPIVGTLVGLLINAVSIVLMVLGIVYAAKDEKKYLPLFDKLPAIVK